MTYSTRLPIKNWLYIGTEIFFAKESALKSTHLYLVFFIKEYGNFINLFGVYAHLRFKYGVIERIIKIWKTVSNLYLRLK